MSVHTRVAGVVLSLTLLAVPLLAGQPPAGQEEFVPVDQLPAAEQLPGGVFVIAAYGFMWLAAMGYLWSIWRRMGRVEDELRAWRRRSGRTSS
jgi:hypothetical protein